LYLVSAVIKPLEHEAEHVTAYRTDFSNAYNFTPTHSATSHEKLSPDPYLPVYHDNILNLFGDTLRKKLGQYL